MDLCLVEMIKYVVNFYLVVCIFFMNEIVNFCDKVGVNVEMVCKGMGSDFWIGKCFLFLGVGFGGSCFFKDV